MKKKNKKYPISIFEIFIIMVMELILGSLFAILVAVGITDYYLKTFGICAILIFSIIQIGKTAKLINKWCYLK